jgi:hypothetical protein
VRFLFALRHAGYLRHFRSTIELLGERDHEVVLALAKHWRSDESVEDLVEQLGRDVPGLTLRLGVETHRRVERDLPFALRQWLGFLWFLQPELKHAVKARTRAGTGIPPELRTMTEAAAENHEFRRLLATSVGSLEQALPAPPEFKELVSDVQPDAVVVSPLLERGTPQINYLRAARELGIPTGLCVASWDNLTNKGPIIDPIDLVAVWNAGQVDEAVNLHGVPRERVATTGAPVYDDWFGREPSTGRPEFSERLGLPPDRPYLLYVCSSGFIAEDEAAWIGRWLGRLRQSGIPELADVAVLVRPHPQKRLFGDGSRRRLETAPGVVIHPPEGEQAVTDDAITRYYDAIYHSAAVVGINTSAMIEGAIAGRGVYTLLSKRYGETQEGMPHFAHLRRAGGGLVHATDRPEEHARALALAVRGEDAAESAERARAFLADFIRPHGLDQPAAPLLVDALESLASTPRRAPQRVPDSPQDWLDRVAADLEPIFHIRSGRSIGARRTKGRSRRRKPEKEDVKRAPSLGETGEGADRPGPGAAGGRDHDEMGVGLGQHGED